MRALTILLSFLILSTVAFFSVGESLAQSENDRAPLDAQEDAAPPSTRTRFIDNCTFANREAGNSEKLKSCTCEADYLSSNMEETEFAIMAV